MGVGMSFYRFGGLDEFVQKGPNFRLRTVGACESKIPRARGRSGSALDKVELGRDRAVAGFEEDVSVDSVVSYSEGRDVETDGHVVVFVGTLHHNVFREELRVIGVMGMDEFREKRDTAREIPDQKQLA
jgi:hypothetical protein